MSLNNVHVLHGKHAPAYHYWDLGPVAVSNLSNTALVRMMQAR